MEKYQLLNHKLMKKINMNMLLNHWRNLRLKNLKQKMFLNQKNQTNIQLMSTLNQKIKRRPASRHLKLNPKIKKKNRERIKINSPTNLHPIQKSQNMIQMKILIRGKSRYRFIKLLVIKLDSPLRYIQLFQTSRNSKNS